MKIRTLAVSILGVLLISSVSSAQEARTPEPAAALDAKTPSVAQTRAEEAKVLAEAARTASSSMIQRVQGETKGRAGAAQAVRGRSVATQRAAAIKPPTQVRIFRLRHITAEEAAKVIMNVLRIQAHPDRRTHSLIVNATQEEIASIESLMQAMDVALPEDSTVGDVEDLVYRVYMFEIASGDRDMKPFSMRVQISGRVSSQELLDATVDERLQIREFLQIRESFEDGHVSSENVIEGKAASNESLKHLVDKFPESHIMELRWDDDETFTNEIAAAQYTQLPEQMQEHVAKFLGNDIRTVGYWFGNLSVPGSVEAPIGPWTLNLSLESESDRMLELRVDVEVPGEMRRPAGRPLRTTNDEILSNTLRAKIGKPIIIGYNRESYGTRKMCAMVIVPEADAL